MSTTRWGATLALLAAISPVVAAAQLQAPARGPLPDYELIGGPPSMFRQSSAGTAFERALFRRTGALQGPVAGEISIPVVLILFRDSPEAPHIAATDVQGSLFDGPSERGTITESYREMSLGALTVRGDTYGWVRSDLSLSEVMGAQGSLVGERTGEFFREALSEIDADVDFTLYDNDGPDGIANSGDDDGYVDIITFEYLEVAMSCGGPAIWPHRSRLSARGGEFVTDDVGVNGDTIRILDYITQSATDCSGQNVQDAGVISHEFGHVLGLPDWYHWVYPDLGPEGRRWVLGCWALMAAGSWGCGPVGSNREPYGPSHMIGLSKSRLGWITPIDPGEVWSDTLELSPIQTSGQALRIPLQPGGGEYLWIEFRDTVGFDHALPTAGVLMYKEHAFLDLGYKPDPTTTDPYPVMLLEQDANRGLLRITPEGGNRGEAGDAWGVGGAGRRLNALTSPELRMTSGQWTSVQIHDVVVEGDKARIVLSTGSTPVLVEPAEPLALDPVRSFSAAVKIFGGRGPYTGEVTDGPGSYGFESGGDEIFLVGSLREGETRDVTFSARDATGRVSNSVTVTLVAEGEWTVTLDGLLQSLLATDAEPLTADELDYLDELGNANGRYDVGDLRKWLRENG
jgi:M6 family metalloprotease-like protein